MRPIVPGIGGLHGIGLTLQHTQTSVLVSRVFYFSMLTMLSQSWLSNRKSNQYHFDVSEGLLRHQSVVSSKQLDDEGIIAAKHNIISSTAKLNRRPLLAHQQSRVLSSSSSVEA